MERNRIAPWLSIYPKKCNINGLSFFGTYSLDYFRGTIAPFVLDTHWFVPRKRSMNKAAHFIFFHKSYILAACLTLPFSEIALDTSK